MIGGSSAVAAPLSASIQAAPACGAGSVWPVAPGIPPLALLHPAVKSRSVPLGGGGPGHYFSKLCRDFSRYAGRFFKRKDGDRHEWKNHLRDTKRLSLKEKKV